jgi:AraC family transcriptional regulator
MKPRIEFLHEKKLIGQKIKMSLADNKTYELWHKFMPRRKEIENIIDNNLYSVQVYDKSLNFNDFTSDTLFEKWAAIEVSTCDRIPAEMETLELSGGFYAVFIFKGIPADFKQTFHYIFNTWLPNSDYQLDQRPHFELLGEKYKNNEPDSEEEVWIPVKSIRRE